MIESEAFIRAWKKKQGSDFIASHRFLVELDKFLKDANGIVDYGAGIGTISAWTKSRHKNIEVLAIEPNDWCRGQYVANLNEFDEIELVESLKDTNLSERRNWVWIIDMAFEEGDARRVVASDPRVVFIEGHRFHQRLAIMRTFRFLGQGFRYVSFGRDKLSPKGGCYLLPDNRWRLRSVIAMVIAYCGHTWFRSIHFGVRLANSVGLGKGAKGPA